MSEVGDRQLCMVEINGGIVVTGIEPMSNRVQVLHLAHLAELSDQRAPYRPILASLGKIIDRSGLTPKVAKGQLPGPLTLSTYSPDHELPDDGVIFDVYNHQARPDTTVAIVAGAQEAGYMPYPMVAIDAVERSLGQFHTTSCKFNQGKCQSIFDWTLSLKDLLTLSLANPILTLRGSSEIARQRRACATQESLNRAREWANASTKERQRRGLSRHQVFFASSTYSPLVDDELSYFWGAAKIALELRKTGTNAYLRPNTIVYQLNARNEPVGIEVQHNRPIAPIENYTTPEDGIGQVRETILRIKREKHSRRTQAQHTEMRDAFRRLAPYDKDYKGGAEFTLDYHEGRAEVESWFRDN